MHNFRVYGISLCMFRTVFLSIIRSARLCIQRQVYVMQVLWLLASKQPQNLTPDVGRKDRPKHVE
jgi:hypothetical protein